VYNPAHFAETDVAVMHRAIENWPLGILVIASEIGFEANHVPFELDRTRGQLGTLQCHVARNNDVWRHLNAACLVIFQGSSAYISPNFYASKRDHGKVVPTYNYAAVHAHGRLTIHDDEKWVRGLVGRLTRRFEAGQPQPWTMGDAPQDYIGERLKEIVGIEIEIARLEGKWKMSQNREEADRTGVVAGLTGSQREAERDVAKWMAERMNPAAKK